MVSPGRTGRRCARAVLAVLTISLSALFTGTGLRVSAAASLNNLPTTYTHDSIPAAPTTHASSCGNAYNCYDGKGAPSAGRIDCSVTNYRCLDIVATDTYKLFDHYVGHDEPSDPFYSALPGSGNQAQWQVKIPTEPPTQPTRSNGVVWNFMLHPAFWFGMALCNDESFPEFNTTLGACQPDSDSNIADNADGTAADFIGNHVGSAYMEFQFYPPGWAPLVGNAPIGGESCDPVKWCAALVVWSLGADGNFNANNSDCVSNSNGGEEFGNASFITFTGHSPIPATPYKNPGAFSPNPNFDMYFNPGDVLSVTMHDVPDSSPGPNGSGLEIVVNDQTTGQTGSTVASGTGPNNNGFATEKFAPGDSTCTMIPYNFHPMYSTSNLHTRVPWAAHTYNVDFTDEVGHFDYCSSVTVNNSGNGGCPGNEGQSTDSEPAENPGAGSFGDDSVCYDGVTSGTTTLVPLSGCLGTNWGFDGMTYQNNAWPDGNFTLRPEPIRFTSPLTGPNYDQNYTDYAFESDMPALEFSSGSVPLFGSGITASQCNILASGAGCTWQPLTDDSITATPPDTTMGFYPWFSIDTHTASQCWWLLGQDVAGQTSNDFNNSIPDSQYGPPYNAAYQQTAASGRAPGTAIELTENFHSAGPDLGGFASPNTCTASSAVVTPEVPAVPMVALVGGIAAAAAVGWRRRQGRRGGASQARTVRTRLRA
jgi:hypothetical protein